MKLDRLLNPSYKEDVEYIRNLINGYIEGNISEQEFKRERLKNGIYGQRQRDFYMIRVKIPGGNLSCEQIRILSDIADKFSNGILHITTRQDIQYHWVKLKDIPKVVEAINTCGLTTKEACGDTVRNVTSCSLSGICPMEIINVSECSRYVAEKFIGVYNTLPRKFKITFSGCSMDCAYAKFNDLGFIAVKQEDKYGFKVYVGGGQGDTPRIGNVLLEFVEPSQVCAVISTVLNIFDELGDRKNKRRNRLKFLIEKLGFDRFREIFEEKYKKSKEWVQDITPSFYDYQENVCLKGIIKQRGGNFFALNIFIKHGNITSSQFKQVSSIAEDYNLGVRLTQDQNILLYNIGERYIKEVQELLKLSGLNINDALTVRDVVCCPGSETCSLGITSSRGLADAILSYIDSVNGKLGVNLPRIKISGCPNSCGHHHVTDIGLHGVAKKIEGKLAPHYVFHFGGTPLKIGRKSLKVPAKNVPEAVGSIIDFYITNRNEGEDFSEFVERVGEEKLRVIIEKQQELKEGVEYYKDFGSDKEFSLEEVGVGECMGIVADMVELSLDEARRQIKQAKAHIEKGFEEDSYIHLKEAIYRACEGLLVPFGIKAKEEQSIDKFIEHVIGRRYVEEKFINVIKKENPAVIEVENFINECEKAYKELQRQTKEKISRGIKDKARKEILDLRKEECPYNFIIAKKKIETMDVGSILVLLLGDEQSLRSVSASMRDHGHEVIDVDQEDNYYTLTVRRR